MSYKIGQILIDIGTEYKNTHNVRRIGNLLASYCC